MEESRKAKLASTSAQTSNNAISESKSQIAGEAKRAVAVPTRRLSGSSSSSSSSNKMRYPGTSDVLAASISASGRPDLKQFKKQQQEALRRVKEAEFFKSRGIAPPIMAADFDSPESGSNATSQRPLDRDRGRVLGSMPPVELYLKAPNSDGILKATLSGNGDEMRFQTHDTSFATEQSSDKSTAMRAREENETTIISSSPDGTLHAPFPYPVGGGDRSNQQHRQKEGSSTREGTASITPVPNEKRRNPSSEIRYIFPLHMSNLNYHSLCPIRCEAFTPQQEPSSSEGSG
jgi:hypothetical protein